VDHNKKLQEGIDTYSFQMLNATAAQSKIVPNIKDLIFTQKTIDDMEYENFLSPDSV